MKLYHCKLTVDALHNSFIAAPEITPEMAKEYRYIGELGEIRGIDGQRYEITLTLKKKIKQRSIEDETS